ncbi:ATP-dependent helicase [Thermodesulfovibrio hydrogeniphilus]
MSLNRNQKIVAETQDKYLCVIAGPGTGKTHTITARVLNLLEKSVNPESIAALTFTQKAAIEMRERIIKKINSEKFPFIGTFHLLCIRLLREFLPEELRNFKLCTRQRQIELLKELKAKKIEKILEKISRFKNVSEPLDEETLSIYQSYERKKKELNLLDFDDLLIKTYEMLKSGSIPPLFEHVIVDEFQDINKIQYEIVKLILKKEGYLAVFGDPDQAIYSFRGSEVKLFLNLPKDFPSLSLINLSINYRSQANIVYASNKFITANTKRFSKKLEPIKSSASKIKIIETTDEYDEAKTIIKEIKSRLGATDFTELYDKQEDKEYTFSSFAVLARTNRELDLIKESLMKAGIPIKTIKNEHTWIDEFLDKIRKLFKDKEAIKKLLTMNSLPQFLSSTNLLDMLSSNERNLIEKIAKFYGKGNLLEQFQCFIDELSGITAQDLFPESINAVSLLTLHGSKGLEFPVVFIIGFEEGLIPCTLFSDSDIEEERRLFYVGMTRAMDELIITHAKKRNIRGQPREMKVSSFLKELPSEYLLLKKASAKRNPKQKGLF